MMRVKELIMRTAMLNADQDKIKSINSAVKAVLYASS
jgi:hypothetical protein